jgi:cell division protein FtsB
MRIVGYFKRFLEFSFKKKFLIITVIFVVWVMFFDKNSAINQFTYKNSQKKLIKEKEYYKEKIASDSVKLNELTTNNELLEKYAREQYFMHKKNEEIFIIVEN